MEDLVYINFISIERETEKAICLKMEGGIGFTFTAWCPKSQIVERVDNNLRLPKWLATRILFGEDYQRAKRHHTFYA